MASTEIREEASSQGRRLAILRQCLGVRRERLAVDLDVSAENIPGLYT